MSKHLIIGTGQVGSALFEVLYDKYDVTGIDIDRFALEEFDVIHVCIPYVDGFVTDVTNYKLQYLAPGGLVIIHSSVAVGTSDRLGAVHSPIRGVHPNLAEGIRTFTKFFGGARAEEAAGIFRDLGITCVHTPDARNTEALKLWDTTYYGWNIVFEKAVHAYCDKHRLDFNIVYTRANRTYNNGYVRLGMPEVLRPVLDHREGPIGGHCVIPNAKILCSEIADFILEKDADYQRKAATVELFGKRLAA